MDFFLDCNLTPSNPTSTPNNINNDIIYDNFKIGDVVKIVYKKNSILNSYKGYVGEIRDYKRGCDNAYIFLIAKQYKTIVNFPIDHFIVIQR